MFVLAPCQYLSRGLETMAIPVVIVFSFLLLESLHLLLLPSPHCTVPFVPRTILDIRYLINVNKANGGKKKKEKGRSIYTELSNSKGRLKTQKMESGRFDSPHRNRNQSNIILAKKVKNRDADENRTKNTKQGPILSGTNIYIYIEIEMENESHSSNVENTYSY
jgi:hypothetical protein